MMNLGETNNIRRILKKGLTFGIVVLMILVAFVGIQIEVGAEVAEKNKETECPNELVSYWKFDEGNGIKANDSAGDNNGTINGAKWVTGKVGKALEFDGVDDYVKILDNESLKPANKTFMVWVKPNNLTKKWNWVLSKVYMGSHYGGRRGYGIGFKYDEIWSETTDENGYYSWLTYGPIKANEWYHLVGVQDISNQSFKLFVNGFLINSAHNVVGFKSMNNNHLMIGNDLYSNNGAFNGTIDEVAIWNRALKGEEILQCYYNSINEVHYDYNGFPIADAREDQSVSVGAIVTLNGSDSYDPDGTIILYEWDFEGDGKFDWNSSSMAYITQNYTSRGNFEAIIRVTDNNGSIGVDTCTIRVGIAWTYEDSYAYGTAIDDIDGDGEYKEIIQYFDQQQIIVFNHTGDILWQNYGNTTWGYPAIEDLDNDNKKEIICFDDKGVRVFNANGTVKSHFPHPPPKK